LKRGRARRSAFLLATLILLCATPAISIESVALASSRLNGDYFEFQKIFARGPSAVECDSYLADSRYIEWHDDLLFRSAMLLRLSDLPEAKWRLMRIVEEFPHAIYEPGIGTPRVPLSDESLSYIQTHPIFTAEKAMLWLGYWDQCTDDDPRRAGKWFEKLAMNSLKNPRYDDNEFQQMSREKIFLPYLAAVETLFAMYSDANPDLQDALVFRLTSEDRPTVLQEDALHRGAMMAMNRGDTGKAMELANSLLARFPESVFANDAWSLLSNEGKRPVPVTQTSEPGWDELSQSEQILENVAEPEGGDLYPPSFRPSPDGDTDLSSPEFAFWEQGDLDGDGSEEDIRWVPLVSTEDGFRLPSRRELLLYLKYKRAEGFYVSGVNVSTYWDEFSNVFYNTALLVQVNGNSCIIGAEGMDVELHYDDTNERDSFVEFYVELMSPSDVQSSDYYCFRNGRIQSMGSITTRPGYDNCDETKDSGNRFTVLGRGNIVGAWPRSDLWELSEEHRFRIVPQEFYEMNIPLTLEYDLRLFETRNDSKPTIHFRTGDEVVLIQTDDIKWIKIQSGKASGWVMADDPGLYILPYSGEDYAAVIEEDAWEIAEEALLGRVSLYTFGLLYPDLP